MEKRNTRQASSGATRSLATALLLHARAAAASNAFATTAFVRFVGPGVVECDRGACEFAAAAGARPDPCHTRTSGHRWDSAFAELADVVGGDPSGGAGDEPRSYGSATNIVSHFPHQFVEIEEGCTAECTGCSFSPTTVISGPALLDCQNAICSQYTTSADFHCGDALGAASDTHGEHATTRDRFVGYKGITSTRPIEIPASCELDCSGCTARAPPAVTTSKTTPGDREAVCATEQDCKNAGAALGLIAFRADDDYRTKGCFSKNGKAFFSRGTAAEMSARDLPGAQRRVHCGGAAPPAPGRREVVCATEEDCEDAGADLGLVAFRAADGYPTKGCFSKNGKAFFSPGTAAEMSTRDLPGAQRRVYCGGANVFPRMTNVAAPELVRVPDASASSAGALRVGAATVAALLASALL